jgi:predicted MFS family arabinose efflux permease
VGHYGAMHDEENGPQSATKEILNRDYALSFLGFFAFLAAYYALIPTLPLYLTRLGSSEREIGVLVGTIGVSSLAARPLVGRVLLRRSERLIMMWGAILFASSFLALAVFRPFWPFLIARLLQGIAFASLDTAAIAYVVRIVPAAHRARAISYFLLATSLASAVASSTAVSVANEFGFTVLLFVCTGLSLGAFLLFTKLRGETARPIVISPLKNARFLEPKILAPSVLTFLVFFSWGGVLTFFPLYSIECGVANPGYFFSANAVMLVLVRLVGGKVLDTYRKETMILPLILISTVCLVALSFSHSLTMFVLVGLLWGVGGGFIAPVAMAYALEYAGSSDGTAVGTYQAFRDLGLTLGPMATGLIVPLTGYRVMFLCLALTCLFNIAYFQFYLRRRRGTARAVSEERSV